MHMIHLVGSEMFDVQVGDSPATADAVFPNWSASDRFGIVIDEPFGAIGASHLVQLAATLFYDVKPGRRTQRKVYPEIYALHYGQGYGAHAPFDFWPARREVIVQRDPQLLLDAINDRAITRLAIPDRPARPIEHRPKEEDAALDRIVSAFIYDATGRTADAQFSIHGNDKRTEYNAREVLRLSRGAPRPASPRKGASVPVKESDTSYYEWIECRKDDTNREDQERAERRRAMLKDEAGLVTETYRYLDAADALMRF